MIDEGELASPVEGGVNFRDLGGCLTGGGRLVRHRQLYRSGTMHALTVTGLRQLSALGVRLVFDLRSSSEREDRPTRLPDDGSIAYYAHHHETQAGNLMRNLLGPGRSAEDGMQFMRAMYRAIPYDLAPLYRELFARVAEGHLPLVFNCAAGKDRTGVAAALLLAALGVTKTQIYEEYLRTEREFEAIMGMFLTGPRRAIVASIERSIWEPLLHSDGAYLDAMYEAIEQRSGSMMAYLETELGLDEAQRDLLRARLLD